MRKEARTKKEISINEIQRYHERSQCGNYATQGFARDFVVWASDRPAAADGTKKTYGLEIELESQQIFEDTLALILKNAFELFPEGLFKLQHDGSLGGSTSAEAITQPMTKAFIRNHYNDFKAMFEFLRKHHTAPGDSCGMHTNIAMICFGKDRAAQKKAILKLHNWLVDHYRFACALLHRDINYTEYCGNMQHGYLNDCGSHGYMMNYAHMDEGPAARVEIRLVGPQKTFPAFRNTLECIFHLVEAAREGRNFDDPVKLWKGCNECVMDRLLDMREAGFISFEDFAKIAEASVNEGIRAATR